MPVRASLPFDHAPPDVDERLRGSPGPAASGAVSAVCISGLPGEGKRRLVEALAARLAGLTPPVRVTIDAATGPGGLVRVHAETDLEAMLESSRFPRDADLVVAVDWEPVARSVARIVALLVSRGRPDAEGA